MSYLEHHNPNHDPANGQFTFANGIRGAASAVGGKILRKKKKPVPPKADIKSSPQGKQANTKLSKEQRAHLVNEGNLAEVTANQDRLSNKELDFAIKRIKKDQADRLNLQKQLAELGGDSETQSTIQKGAEYVEKAAKAGKSLKDYGDQAKTVWNFMATVHNVHAEADDKWFTFDKDGKPQSNGPSPDAFELVTKGSASDIIKNKDKLTTDQLKEWNNRRKELDKIDQYKAADDKAAEKAKKTEEFNKQKAASEKAAAKAEAKAERKAQREAAKAKIAQERQWRKDAKEAAKQASADRTDYDAYNKQLNQYEKEAFKEAKSQNRQQNRDIPIQVYDSGNDNTLSRKSFSTSYQPSQAVKDFVSIYYDQPIVAEAAGAAVDFGINTYKQRKKRNY